MADKKKVKVTLKSGLVHEGIIDNVEGPGDSDDEKVWIDIDKGHGIMGASFSTEKILNLEIID